MIYRGFKFGDMRLSFRASAPASAGNILVQLHVAEQNLLFPDCYYVFIVPSTGSVSAGRMAATRGYMRATAFTSFDPADFSVTVELRSLGLRAFIDGQPVLAHDFQGDAVGGGELAEGGFGITVPYAGGLSYQFDDLRVCDPGA